MNEQLCKRCLSGIFLILILIFPGAASAQVWTVLAGDPKGDTRDATASDAAQLAYRYDKQHDRLWFRISLYGTPNKDGFGVNLVFDTAGDDAAKMNWWGANTAFRFDRIVTAWVTRSDKGYEGTIGVGDVAGVKARQINNLLQNNLEVGVEGDSIVIGVKRTDITDKLKMSFIAAVGTNKEWNDDVPNAGSVTIDLAAEKPTRGLREIDVSRNNLEFPSDLETLAETRGPLIARKGQGTQTLILVPGMYSGATSFEAFISRNQSQYRFLLVTPPGINGTSPRPMPAAGASFSEMSWTRRLERDLLDLIGKEKLSQPVIVAERQPAAQAAIELALEHPDKVGGVILVGTNLVQFFPAPKDPTRKSPIAFPDRVVSVDQGWAARWFKYVTPETWRSGDLPPQMLSNDPARAQKAWEELEAAPLQIKIRYLCEFWASDVTRSFDKLQVPVMALVPGFDEKFLADPANSFAKTAFLTSWDTLAAANSKLELVKIPEARMLVLDDQPKRADEAIATFVAKINQMNRTRKQ